MTGENPYRLWVQRVAASLHEGEAIAMPERPAEAAPTTAVGPKALVFSPHPDDEVIVGGLLLRLKRECGFAVVNVAVTLGSKVERRAARWQELEAACAYLGFALVGMGRDGLEGVRPEARSCHPAQWADSVRAIAGVIEAERPEVVVLPHAADWNRTHIGVHELVKDAMRSLPTLDCLVVETEYWGAMAAPNLMLESTSDDVADLVAALSLHAGEVARNPYHLRLPAWMIDNVRRGAELVGGQGGPAPGFAFATLYRLQRWREGQVHDVLERGRAVAATEDLAQLFLAAAPWR